MSRVTHWQAGRVRCPLIASEAEMKAAGMRLLTIEIHVVEEAAVLESIAAAMDRLPSGERWALLVLDWDLRVVPGGGKLESVPCGVMVCRTGMVDSTTNANKNPAWLPKHTVDARRGRVAE